MATYDSEDIVDELRKHTARVPTEEFGFGTAAADGT